MSVASISLNHINVLPQESASDRRIAALGKLNFACPPDPKMWEEKRTRLLQAPQAAFNLFDGLIEAEKIPFPLERDREILGLCEELIDTGSLYAADNVLSKIHFPMMQSRGYAKLSNAAFKRGQYAYSSACLSKIENAFERSWNQYKRVRSFVNAADFVSAKRLADQIDEQTGMIKQVALAEIYEAGLVMGESFDPIEDPLKPEQKELTAQFITSIKKKNYEEAAKLVEQMPIVVEQERSFYALAEVFLDLGQLERAIAYVERMTLDYMRDQARHLIANYFADQGDVTAALEFANQTPLLDETPVVDRQVALLYLAAGNVAMAVSQALGFDLQREQFKVLKSIVSHLSLNGNPGLAFDIVVRFDLPPKEELALLCLISTSLKTRSI